MDEKLGDRLIEFRNRKGLSQDELSQKLEVSRQSISNWENGTSQPSIDFVKKLAEIYEVSVDDLLNTSKPIEDCYKKENKASSNNNEESKKRTSVHISKKGIFVNEGDDDETVKFSFGDGIAEDIKETVEAEIVDGKFSDDDEKRRKKALHKSIKSLIDIIFILGAVVGYCVLGFLLPSNEGWMKWWIICIFSLVPGEIYKTFAFKKPEYFPIAYLAIGTYCTIGEFLNIWHPTWIIALIIPVYYILVSSIKSIVRNSKKANIK